YLAHPEANLVVVPDGVAPEHAALAEPLACGWHTVRLAEAALDRPLAEADCLVIGGGAIGVGAALALGIHGAERITIAETNPLRREVLARTTEVALIDPRETAPRPAHLVIDAVGYAATRALASEVVHPGGVIAHIGLGSAEGGLDIRRATLQEITFFGTYTYTAAEFRQTAEAIFAGQFGSLAWIEERPLAEGQAVFEAIDGGQMAAPKVIFRP
ncbi:MAG: zinc-binding dehydrogenase, partial [Pseudomonadota bacterium]